MPYCVGVTGGIGSGKSRAAALFGELGAAVIDTDEIAHQLTASGGRAMPAVIAAFGTAAAAADGSMDRAAMRKRVFEHPESRKQLENILHPLIRETARDRVAQSTAPYALLVVPLLLETGGYRDLISRILVIDCDESLQISRTMQRSKLDEGAVRAIMAAQLPRSQRLAGADDVIRNDGDLADLQRQVAALHRQYLQRASAARGHTPADRH